MILFVSIIHVIVCLALIGIILLQPGRGMGLTGAAFGGDSQSVFGVKTADVLTKVTTGAAVLFMATCIVLSALNASKSRSLYSSFQDQSPITMEQVQRAVQEAQEKAAASDVVSSVVEEAASSVSSESEAVV